MANKTNSSTWLFAILAVVFTLSTFVKPYPLSWLVKLLPMVLLILLALFKAKTMQEKLFVIGLVFSAGGDFFLDYDRVNWFVFGLASFLTAHLFYVASLQPQLEKLKENKGWVCAYFVTGLVLFYLMFAQLGALFAPVFVYMLVLLLMAISTLLTARRNTWLVVGGLSFVVSDGMIGLDKFHEQLAFHHSLIMVTYYFAQYSLFSGMFKK